MADPSPPSGSSSSHAPRIQGQDRTRAPYKKRAWRKKRQQQQSGSKNSTPDKVAGSLASTRTSSGASTSGTEGRDRKSDASTSPSPKESDAKLETAELQVKVEAMLRGFLTDFELARLKAQYMSMHPDNQLLFVHYALVFAVKVQPMEQEVIGNALRCIPLDIKVLSFGMAIRNWDTLAQGDVSAAEMIAKMIAQLYSANSLSRKVVTSSMTSPKADPASKAAPSHASADTKEQYIPWFVSAVSEMQDRFVAAKLLTMTLIHIRNYLGVITSKRLYRMWNVSVMSMVEEHPDNITHLELLINNHHAAVIFDSSVCERFILGQCRAKRCRHHHYTTAYVF